MPSSSLASATTSAMTASASPLLCPAARGSFLCFCRGEVIEMSAQYGWLKVNGSVSHPLAEMHNGHIYVHKKDMATAQCLVAGDAVTFYLYVDDKGLGAEACKGEGTTNHAAVVQMHASSWSSWSSRQVKPQHQYSAFAPPFVPLGSVSLQTSCTEEPLEVIDYSVLPSAGSVGHSDGSCKRCAFFPKGRCQNGENCEHCHFDHVGRKRLRTRKPRSQQKSMEEPVPPEDIDEEHSEDAGLLDELLDTPEAELLDMQEAGGAKQQQQQQSKQDDDSHSDNGSTDLATVAPSSSYPSDDEGSPKHRPFEMSDTESCSSHPDAMWPLDFHQELATFIQKNSIVEPLILRAIPTVQDFGFNHVADDDCASSSGTDTSGEQSPSSSTNVDLSPMSWSSLQRRRRTGESDVVKDLTPAEITRKARALLNKLTHDRFESLCSQILALPLSTPEQLAALAAEIFEKATTQDGFRSLYTELCLRLDAHFGGQSSVIGGKTFRKILVNECQATFDRNLQTADAALFENLTTEESFELEMKLKTRRLGNMRFIGELLVQRLLAQKLMTPIMLELLNGDEVALESLIAFLTIVAPCFDQKASKNHAHLQDVFTTLRRKKNDKQLSCRLHCHLSDLFDSRARGWAVHSA